MSYFCPHPRAGRALPGSGGATFPEAEVPAGCWPAVTGVGVTVASGQPGLGPAGVVWVQARPQRQAVDMKAPRCPGLGQLPVPLKGERGRSMGTRSSPPGMRAWRPGMCEGEAVTR